MLKSHLSVPVSDAEPLLRQLVDHLPDEPRMSESASGSAQLDLYGARVDLRPEGGHLFITVQAGDAGQHLVAKGIIAFHAQNLLGNACPELRWRGDGENDRTLSHFREMVVVRSESITPRMRRVTLQGENLERFARGGLHIRLLIPPSGRRKPLWPYAGPAALPIWPDGDDKLTLRSYTIRKIDPRAGTIKIDVALHEPPSAGCQWALGVAPGDLVGIMGPGGGGIEPADWYLLAGDETALPAIGRILEELPADAKGRALIEVEDEGERQDLRRPSGVEIEWLFRRAPEVEAGRLLKEAVAGVTPPEGLSVYAWAGCEFAAFKAIRSIFRKDWRLRGRQQLAVAYWRRGCCEGDAAG